MEENQKENEYQKSKTKLYWISFAIMFILSVLTSFKMLHGVLNYVQSENVSKSVLPMFLGCFSTGAMCLFTILLIVHFFSGEKSIVNRAVPMLILGVCASLGAFFSNFFAHKIVCPNSALYLNIVLAVIFILHLFFVPEFQYYVDEDDEELDEGDDSILNNEDDYIEGKQNSDNTPLQSSSESDNVNKEEQNNYKHTQEKHSSDEEDDDEDFL